MTSLNQPALASVLTGGEPTELYNTETQFLRGTEIAILRQMLIDKYGEQSDIAKALQAQDAATLLSAFNQANPSLDSDPEIVRVAQDLLK